MPALTTSLSSLASSILDTLTSVLTSVLTSILGIFEHLLSLVWGVFAPFFDAVGTAISGLAQTFSGVLKFILSQPTPALALSRALDGEGEEKG